MLPDNDSLNCKQKEKLCSPDTIKHFFYKISERPDIAIKFVTNKKMN
jgi:hypothetical protein